MIEKFKYYKSKDKLPSFNDVIDCSEKDKDKIEQIQIKYDGGNSIYGGLKHPDDWEIYKIKNCPGLIIIKNAFTSLGQRYWIKTLLNYTKDNPNNLLESKFCESARKNFFKAWSEEKDEQKQYALKKAMRWSTLGFHYNWTTKEYNEDYKNDFPRELNDLICTIANILGFQNYKSEAAIINFYYIGTTLAAHKDISEHCNSPLFSLSFGQSAIFLIGGENKDDDAIPILLNSGDIVVMSNESRFLYHAVPRIFETTKQSWNNFNEINHNCENFNENDLHDCMDEEKWKVFDKYLKDSRINVNVRQFKK
ncbi:hypothetical protein PVAND_000412 [Polypedilum vanderplanki]|uniref:Fe2OG dioxygenase domain-containing protein n=1 Tax=Polypedilum vanderplanki TaxID=319348 RepID=A0A9J6BK61_POLVA|nr:hypothetical protein PVAND_000412 [Polypedilum vanderplanki]